MTNLELLPLASPMFESGPPREDAVELARVVDRGIRESESIDLSKLCITPGEKYGWYLLMCMFLTMAEYYGCRFAWRHSSSSDSKIACKAFDVGEDIPVPMRDVPVAVTAVEIGGTIMLDPSLNETEHSRDKIDCYFKPGRRYFRYAKERC